MEELETLPEGASPEQESPQSEPLTAAEAATENAGHPPKEQPLPPVEDPTTESPLDPVEHDRGEEAIPPSDSPPAVDPVDVIEQPLPPTESPAPGPSVSMDELMAPDEAVSEEPAPIPLADSQLRAVLEAIVYVAEEPLTLAQISAALQQPIDRVRVLLDQLVSEFDKPEHGLTVREVAGGYKMATKAEHHEAVRSFVKSLKPPLKLSLPALETLAVIAYKQPVTSPEIMEIRGVRGAGVLNTLLDRKLIAAAGRKNVIGKPILYKTTKEFLIQFGLKDLSELPSLKEFEEIRRMAFSDSEVAPEPAPEPAPDGKSPDSPRTPPAAPADGIQAAEAQNVAEAAVPEATHVTPPESESDSGVPEQEN